MIYSVAVIREPAFFVLAALAPAPLHGYAILKRVERLSEGRVRIGPGTLYAALDRLVRDGALAPAGEEIVDGRLRRRYRITGEGRRLLRERAERYAANAAVARAALAADA